MKNTGQKSFALLGALIIILILATFGVGVVVFISSRNQGTISQITSSKALYSLQAGIEFAERKLRGTGEGVSLSTIAGTYEFGNTTFTLANSGGDTVIVTGNNQDAVTQYRLEIPQVNQGNCIIIDTSDVNQSTAKLRGITLQRAAGCSISLTITALTATWAPNNNERLDRIKIEEAAFEYDSPTGIASGETAQFNNNYTINDNSIRNFVEIQWDTNLGGDKDFDFVGIMSDGSTKAFSAYLLNP